MYIMGDVLRILDRFRITGRGVVYTVKISKGCIIHIGDVLLDLRGNRFEVSGIEMFRGIIAEGKSFEDMPLGLMFKQLDGVEAYGNILVKDLNDINFIFCNHPLYQRKVDEDYEVEYQEAGLHHSCALFSYEDMERGKLSLFGEEISGLTIYRGWMMKPEMYSDFYTLLEQKGIYLINTPEEYERYHTLPGWYDDFADETAQSVWETEGNVENALLKAKQLSGSWFSSSWLNDPTIKAMLNMLDSIHEIFKGEDYEDFFEKLTDDDEDSYIIYFYFLDLGEYNLGDSIYIKLNARGKDLTNYENFKAKLSKYITDEIGTPKDDYIAKLDGEWSEVFWEFVKDNSTKLYDEKIMNFFTNFMINEYAAYMTASGRDPVRAEIREVIGYSHLDFINRFQGYNDKWDGHKIADSFVKIFELFDLMTSGKNQVIFAQGNKYFDEQALFKWIIENNDTEKADNKSGISYSTRIQADAYLGFIIQNNSLISTPDVFKEKLIDWMRVVMTLSRETNYNGGDDYVRAISKGVRKMLPESGDILTYLDKLTDRSGHGFDGDCFDEECLKAKLILRSPEWEKLVIAAEDNKYFNGQIGFLFEISGIDKQFKNACVDKWDAATDQEYRSLFEKYFNIFSSIFGEFTIAGMLL